MFEDFPDACIEYSGYRNQAGYGTIQAGDRMEKAHRLAYRLFVGRNPSDREVCHSCDNPACINPRHLFLGSHQENMVDRGEKARHRGMPPWKLAGIMARLLMLDDERGVQGQVAREYGVAHATVSRIWNGKHQQQFFGLVAEGGTSDL
jgi:hypothetical protein